MKPAGLLLLLLILSGPALAEDRSRWAGQATPAEGPAEPIGGHALGCVAGAHALPAEGAGYQVLRPQRNRYWGHPVLVRFVADIAERLHAQGGGPILVGDLSQPRGGPMAFGHGSHQNGLDVDIWFRLPPAPLPAPDLERPEPLTMVTPEMAMTSSWGEPQLRVLRTAARDSRVDRIFVNAAIKRAACQAEPPGGREWLRKLRPWWGHDEHFHVRLACPTDAPACEMQAPLPPGDGCDDLDWWFGPEARPTRAKPAEQSPRPPLPSRCEPLLGS